MAEALIWFLTVEALGLAALPLAGYLFRAFPDRGYGLSKPLGILLVAFVNWWLGSIAGLGNYPAVLWLLVIALAAGGFVLYRSGLAALPDDRQGLLRIVALEEALFIVAFACWAIVRSHNPDIYATEKPMDYMLLQVSGATHHFPPPDAWLSGHTVNYYYLGYAIFGMLGRMSGIDPRIGFNLANVTIFALGCSGGYAITFALTRSRWWGFAGTFAVMLAGDLDGAAQVLSQIGSGGLNENGLNLWCSTRIIDGPCSNYHTITEFPIFSVLWNDLHPHVMALPFALLAIGFAIHAMLDADPTVDPLPGHVLRLACTAVVLGALFPINSWDYPTYLFLVVAAMAAGAYRHDRLTGRYAWQIAALVPVSLLLYLPYFLTVHSSTGIGVRANASDLGEVLTVVGGLFVPLTIFVLWRFGAALVAESAASTGTENPRFAVFSSLPAGSGWWLVGAVAFLLFALPGHSDLLFALLIGLAGCTIWLRLRQEDEDPAALMVLGLALTGCLLLLFSDYVYLSDNFDNSASYRMNTVFKLYYQTWLVLAAGAPYAVFAIARFLRERSAGLYIGWSALAGLLAAALIVYPIEGVGSQGATQGPSSGLDGLAYMRTLNPTDYAAVIWIQAHVPADAVIAEAEGSALAGSQHYGSCTEYWVCGPTLAFSRISALSGRSTVIGWPASHEALWRGAFGSSANAQAAAGMLSQREADIRTLYTTTDRQQAISVLRRYHINYVYVGPLEQTTYVDELHSPPSALSKFSGFLNTAFTQSGGTLYSVPASIVQG